MRDKHDGGRYRLECPTQYTYKIYGIHNVSFIVRRYISNTFTLTHDYMIYNILIFSELPPFGALQSVVIVVLVVQDLQLMHVALISTTPPAPLKKVYLIIR